ncbi:MAG: carboxypeptidase-like regulatory domain-containing protein [Fibrobacter sp.]|nr:carboxypeptidase-like regulatory domain-containing protein [Fibrobacter sp.]
MTINFYKLLISCLLLALTYCSTTPIAGSETTNGITVAVVDNKFLGTTTPSSRVYCFSSTYNPDSGTGFADTVTADTYGRFTISDCPLSTYTIYTYSSGIDSAAIIQNISNSSNKPDTGTAFQGVASINGTTSNDGAAIVNALVYIPGTPFITTSDSSGTFSIQNIPKGTFTIHSYLVSRWIKGVISDSATVNLSEDTDRSVTLNLK